MTSKLTFWFAITCMIIGLPILGISLGDADFRTYLAFPPLTRYVVHAPFDPSAFALISAIDLLMVCGLVYLLMRKAFLRSVGDRRKSGQFPIWGWLGMGVMLMGWILAWTRFPWFEQFQPHTFSMPWIGYILLINALCIKRSGRSLLTDAPTRFMLIWPVSALFWWFFEYLNRYVQNWYYVGVDDFTPIQYVLHASFAFATVLPAVLSTQRFLLTYGAFNDGLKSVSPLAFIVNKRFATLILPLSGLCLMLIGRYPDFLYPLIWSAPLLVITSLQTLRDEPTIFSGLPIGDWRAVIASAVAALICGFIWELWNYHSLAHWEYAVPYVDRFHVFQMPLLGYGGYLPFGLECLLVGQMVLGNRFIGMPDRNLAP